MNKLSTRKEAILNTSEHYAQEYSRWLIQKQYFQTEDLRYLKFLIPAQARILDLGCGLGDALAALNPSLGIGLDFSAKIIELAKSRHPASNLQFIQGDIEDQDLIDSLIAQGPFDIILMSDVIGLLEDCQQTLAQLKPLCQAETLLIISY